MLILWSISFLILTTVIILSIGFSLQNTISKYAYLESNLVIRFLMLILGVFGIIGIWFEFRKVFLYPSYLKLSETGLELKHLTFLQKEIFIDLPWQEISKIYETTFRRRYRLKIDAYGKGYEIPYEIWQNSLRTKQIRSELKKYPVKFKPNFIAQFFGIIGDISLIIIILVLISIVVLATN